MAELALRIANIEINEVFLEFLNAGIPKVPRRIYLRMDHFNHFSDQAFLYRFRLEKGSVMVIHNLIVRLIEPATNRNRAIPSLTRLLVTLRFYATAMFHVAVADFSGISKTSAVNIVALVTNAIASQRERFVGFPLDEEGRKRIKGLFYDKAKFPNVIGAIDCTHVKIISPGGIDAEIYRNRKGYFSINVQTISDAELRILDVVARWPGSVHDQRIFNNSKIMHRFENGEFPNCFLIGDGGYEVRSYLMTPLEKTTTAVENLYNESIIRTRNVVERSYGVLKRRFPILSVGVRSKKVETVLAISEGSDVPEPEVALHDDGDIFIPAQSRSVDHQARRNLIDKYFKQILQFQNN